MEEIIGKIVCWAIYPKFCIDHINSELDTVGYWFNKKSDLKIPLFKNKERANKYLVEENAKEIQQIEIIIKTK